MRLGLITYQSKHLKTEQVFQRLLQRLSEFDLRFYALPFAARKPRTTLIQHRPSQANAVPTRDLAEKHKIPYLSCESDRDIDNECDIYLVLGAGILSEECVEGKRIINCHPGIIPASRGLDSFKWAIHEMKPVGISLHYIDKEVDAGEIIAVVPTEVYPSDSIETLARRHYENEIDILSRFDAFLQNPTNPYADIEVGDARMRMPLRLEENLQSKFEAYRLRYGTSATTK
jgi:phosphoribosylglycinamide formyltransferase-1